MSTVEPKQPVSELLESAIDRRILLDHDGYSGAVLERVALADGRRLILKRISTRTDAIMRATRDPGRAALLWTSGVLDRLPPVIDHTVVAAERDGDGWLIAMSDVSDALLPDDRSLSRAESRRILEAAAAMHRHFIREQSELLCQLIDHLAMLTPNGGAKEAARLAAPISSGWERFHDLAPREVADAIVAIHNDPRPLSNELARHGLTMIHGDLFFGNAGLYSDRVVMIDWGLATAAPPAFEFTWYLSGNWSRIAATREEIIDDFRAAEGEMHDEEALRLSFLATFSELGWNKAYDSVEASDPAIRDREAADLAWWVQRAFEALEVWSPAD
jgi:thiamine kinase-like enzyme